MDLILVLLKLPVDLFQLFQQLHQQAVVVLVIIMVHLELMEVQVVVEQDFLVPVEQEQVILLPLLQLKEQMEAQVV